eukprot:366212-Chlamydomonas_euryale.AAC.22
MPVAARLDRPRGCATLLCTRCMHIRLSVTVLPPVMSTAWNLAWPINPVCGWALSLQAWDDIALHVNGIPGKFSSMNFCSSVHHLHRRGLWEEVEVLCPPAGYGPMPALFFSCSGLAAFIRFLALLHKSGPIPVTVPSLTPGSLSQRS